MNHIEYVAMSGAEPQQVLASTLCMMSCTMQSGSWLHIEKIADNLNWLSDCVALETPLRRLCQHLACHWEAELSAHESHTNATGAVANPNPVPNPVPNHSPVAGSKNAAAPAAYFSTNADTEKAQSIAIQVILKAQIH